MIKLKRNLSNIRKVIRSLEATNIITKCPIKKLDNKYVEFFKILKKVKKSAYYLKLPSQ